MNRVVTKVVEIDAGELVTYSGNYDFYERERAQRETQREAAFARQQAMLAKEQRFIERFQTHASKAAQVQSRVKKLEKIETIELPKKRAVVRFDFRPPPRSGDDVAILEKLSKGYGERRLYTAFDFLVRRGERWCVMGVNGAGKTTLLKMVAGVLPPDGGTVRLGASVKLGYFSQQALDLLDPGLTVLEQVQGDFPAAGLGVLRALLGAFQFSGDEVDKRVRFLSGGERSRLVMARMLFDPPNFLVLDEPTNHLDLATKEMLVEALSKFDGTMLFVSHDRVFLRGLSNRVLELTGEDRRDSPRPPRCRNRALLSLDDVGRARSPRRRARVALRARHGLELRTPCPHEVARGPDHPAREACDGDRRDARRPCGDALPLRGARRRDRAPDACPRR